MNRATILCVDDDRGLLDFYNTLLSANGYEVILADTGEAALQELACRGRGIQLVISDHDMREMDGAQLAMAIKHLYPKLAVMLISGSRHRLEQSAHLVDATLVKGESINRMVNRIAELVAAQRRRPLPVSRPNYLPLGSALAGVAMAALILPRIWK